MPGIDSSLKLPTRASLLTVLWVMAIASLTFGAENRPAHATPPIASAAEIDYPPFSIVGENTRADGFSVKLMRAALAAMGREERGFDIRTTPTFEIALGELAEGRHDAVVTRCCSVSSCGPGH